MSRKITEQAANAFFAGKKFTSANTSVQREILADGEAFTLRLHGNAIACRYTVKPGTVLVSMCGWATPTTRERLNGILPIGQKIGQKRGEQYMGETKINEREIYTIDLQANAIAA